MYLLNCIFYIIFLIHAQVCSHNINSVCIFLLPDGTHKPKAPCNSECFMEFANYLTNRTSTVQEEHDRWCANTVHMVGSAMKALVCTRILSNIPQPQRKMTLLTRTNNTITMIQVCGGYICTDDFTVMINLAVLDILQSSAMKSDHTC